MYAAMRACEASLGLQGVELLAVELPLGVLIFLAAARIFRSVELAEALALCGRLRRRGFERR